MPVLEVFSLEFKFQPWIWLNSKTDIILVTYMAQWLHSDWRVTVHPVNCAWPQGDYTLMKCVILLPALVSSGWWIGDWWNIDTNIHHRSQNLHQLYPAMELTLWVFCFFFLLIKITTVCQVHMSMHLLRSKHEDKTHAKRRMERKDHGRIGFAFVFVCMVGKKPQSTPNWAPWLTRPLHGSVYEVWDLWCISCEYWRFSV